MTDHTDSFTSPGLSTSPLSSSFEALLITPPTTPQSIRRAYHEGVLKTHPDKSGTPTTAPLFRRYQRAYEILEAAEFPASSSPEAYDLLAAKDFNFPNKVFSSSTYYSPRNEEETTDAREQKEAARKDFEEYAADVNVRILYVIFYAWITFAAVGFIGIPLLAGVDRCVGSSYCAVLANATPWVDGILMGLTLLLRLLVTIYLAVVRLFNVP